MRNSDDERQLTDYVFTTAAKLIDSQGNRNDLRNQYANLMATRDWVNRDMDQLVTGIIRALEPLERELARPGDRLADWIDKAIDLMVDAHFAAMVLSTSDIARDLDRTTLRDMQKTADVWEQFANPRRGGLGRDDRRRDEPARGGIGAVRTSFGRGRDEPESSDSWSFLANAGQAADDDDRDDRQPEREEPRRARAEPVLKPEPVPETFIEGPDYTKADPWADFYEAGEHWQAAHRSSWKLTPVLNGETVDEIDLVPKYYDINLFIKYLVKNERGEVREELIEVTDENKYLSHQLLADADRNYKPPVRSASVSLNPRAPVSDTFTNSEATTTAAYDGPPPALVDLLSQLGDEQVDAVTNSGVEDSLFASVFSSRAKLMCEKGSARLDLSVLRTPVLVSSDEQVELIDKINTAPTMTAAALLMQELRPQFDPALYDVLNTRLSKTLRHITKFQFQYGGLSEQINFADHFGKVIEHVSAKRGKEWAAAYATRISLARSIACTHLGKEDINTALAGLVDNPDVKAVVFADYQMVISLDSTLDRLGLGKAIYSEEKGLAVTSANHPKLFDALATTYRRISKLYNSVTVRVYISTSDNRIIEIMPFSARSEAFILGLIS